MAIFYVIPEPFLDGFPVVKKWVNSGKSVTVHIDFTTSQRLFSGFFGAVKKWFRTFGEAIRVSGFFVVTSLPVLGCKINFRVRLVID